MANEFTLSFGDILKDAHHTHEYRGDNSRALSSFIREVEMIFSLLPPTSTAGVYVFRRVILNNIQGAALDVMRTIENAKPSWDDLKESYNQFYQEAFMLMFHKNFLSEVLYLQEQIKNIQRNKVSLKDICYAPLANDETDIQTSNCVIQSIWGYFKDDLSRLDDHDEDNGFNVTYLDEIYQCTSNPYLCLASYGGPVDPAIALGGFLKLGEQITGSTKYELADALILTFLVNNHHNKEMLVHALDWEQHFVEFMLNYTKNNRSSNMDIAFTAERSIEDELNRESQSDVLTILVSYIIMFMYIAISLGHPQYFLLLVYLVMLVYLLP
ncbi:uncharacterized protein Dwil_GK26859 [Drosophila willistoni]|uniref:NPC1 middle luminal domain-containing protein n=1 Tax=Drosophila willistoni TaxID=7260 RepID=A0A0Q9WWN7_DROWI|nr:uncharacterized protein Dwil_GK26859 [Drosophila willistoni]